METQQTQTQDGNAACEVVIIRPPVYFSVSAYSTPLALPMGIAYLAAVLEENGRRVQVIDALGEGIQKISISSDPRFKVQGITNQEILERIPRDCKVIGLSVMFSQEWPFIRELLRQIKQLCPQAKLVLGGEHVTALPEYSLRDAGVIDYVVRGEGERTFVDLVTRVLKKEFPDQTPGVSLLVNGNYQENPFGSQRIIEVNTIPWPAWHLFDLEPYFQPNFTMGISQGRNMAMLATRGCPFRCTFCSSPSMWTTRYVMRDVKDVVDEIELYKHRYEINSIDFYDLTAIIKKEWILAFTEELLKRKLDIVWQLPSGTRSEALDDEVLEALSKTKLKFLVYAPESGSASNLKRIKKQIRLPKMTESIRSAKRLGIIVKANFVIGFPEETRREVYETLLYCWKLAWYGVDDVNVCLFSPYPGSELFRQLRHEGKIKQIDDEYFKGLMTQFDLMRTRHFSRTIFSFELILYRFLGLAVFYGLSYLISPRRWLRLLTQLGTSRKFQPNSLFEQRVSDMKKRRANLPQLKGQHA